jgi:hypothetical protein
MKQLGIVRFGKPFGIPGLDYPKPEADRINFLAQNLTSAF